MALGRKYGYSHIKLTNLVRIKVLVACMTLALDMKRKRLWILTGTSLIVTNT